MTPRRAPILLILLTFLPLTAAFPSAGSDAAALHWGLKIGAGATCLTHHHLYMLGSRRITFAAGLTGEYRINPWLSARLSAEYTHKGGAMINPRLLYAKNDPMLGIPELKKTLYSTNLTVHTVEIPLTACFRIPLSGAFKPFVQTGASFGHNFYARADNYYLWEFPGAPNDLMDETSDFVIDRLAPWVISIYTGIGTEIHTSGRCILETGLTFRLGMTYEDRFVYTLFHKFSTVSTLAFIGIKF